MEQGEKTWYHPIQIELKSPAWYNGLYRVGENIGVHTIIT